jgi:cation-transporting ATPase E
VRLQRSAYGKGDRVAEAAPTLTARGGLSTAEVADRVARGLVNDVPSAPTRTIGQIVRSNVLTRFNLLLGSLLAVILVVGPLQDALFGLVIVANTVVGIVQELRAKRTLDRLEVVNAPRARVVRDGRVGELAVGQVVLDDVLEAAAGDQVVVDGQVLDAAGLEVDESLVTGESEPVARRAGDRLLSGSFVAAGSGRYQATKVGREAYAVQLTEQARRFTLARSELRAGVDQILKYVTWALVPTAVLLFVSQLRLEHGVRAGLSGAVAGTVAMVPEGLVLLTSVAFAVGVVRLGRRQVLVRELPAVETLARASVVEPHLTMLPYWYVGPHPGGDLLPHLAGSQRRAARRRAPGAAVPPACGGARLDGFPRLRRQRPQRLPRAAPSGLRSNAGRRPCRSGAGHRRLGR